MKLMLSFITSASCCFFFFFNDTATTEIYTLSLHDALPISLGTAGASIDDGSFDPDGDPITREQIPAGPYSVGTDRKSTRLNSSHLVISYAVFCLKKKKERFRGPCRARWTARRWLGMNVLAT